MKSFFNKLNINETNSFNIYFKKYLYPRLLIENITLDKALEIIETTFNDNVELKINLIEILFSHNIKKPACRMDDFIREIWLSIDGKTRIIDVTFKKKQ